MPCDFGYRNGKTADPPQVWSKLKTNDAVSGAHGIAGYGVVFRTRRVFVNGCFVVS